MNEAKYAAMLADEIEGIVAVYKQTYFVGKNIHSETEMKITPKGEKTIVDALRAYAPQTAATQDDDTEDMAACGRSLMAAIAAVQAPPSELADWAPAEDPAEIVTDLYELLQEARDKEKNAIQWAVDRWVDEVRYRPLVNIHRRTLDDTWRQVIRHFGGDPDLLIGPAHDELLAAAKEPMP